MIWTVQIEKATIARTEYANIVSPDLHLQSQKITHNGAYFGWVCKR